MNLKLPEREREREKKEKEEGKRKRKENFNSVNKPNRFELIQTVFLSYATR